MSKTFFGGFAPEAKKIERMIHHVNYLVITRPLFLVSILYSDDLDVI
jgi:hypothetical protein